MQKCELFSKSINKFTFPKAVTDVNAQDWQIMGLTFRTKSIYFLNFNAFIITYY